MSFLRSLVPFTLVFISAPLSASDLVLPFVFDRHKTPMIELDLGGEQVALTLERHPI